MTRTLAGGPAVLALALLAAAPATGQDAPDLEQKLEKKLAEPWLKRNPWITDYEQAKATAKETGKLVFAYFTRSYAY